MYQTVLYEYQIQNLKNLFDYDKKITIVSQNNC